MIKASLNDEIGWTTPVRRLVGRAWSRHRIEVYVDFRWTELVGHRQRTFPNYLSLVRYVDRHLPGKKRRALVLTEDDSHTEGRYPDTPDFELIVVNIRRYREVASNDAAGAYFAGMQGAPRAVAASIRSDDLSPEETSELFQSLATAAAVVDWIERHPAELQALGSTWLEIGRKCTSERDLIHQLNGRLCELSDEARAELVQSLAAPGLPISIVEAAQLTMRRAATEEFRLQLVDRTWSEKQWQAFFEAQEWIFGHGLLYQFTHLIQRETLVGGKGLDNRGGQVADFAVSTAGINASFLALVDIKTPTTELVCARAHRNGAYCIAPGLAEAVSQILSNCDLWTRDGSTQPDNIARAIRERWATASPRGILVLGHTAALKDNDARQSFELFRRHLHGIEILTFDELLMRAESVVSCVRTAQPAN